MNIGLRAFDADAMTGIAPVMMTPFLDDGSIDLASFDRVVEYLVGLEVPAIMFPGFASEFYKLSDREKVALGTRLIGLLSGTQTVPILAVHAHATTVAVAEARAWVDAGATALNILPPHYMSPSRSALIEHCDKVLQAVSDTSVVLQYAPAGAAGLLADDVRQLAASHPNLVGVKVEARPPYGFIAELQSADAPVACMIGNGGLYMLDSLRAGAVGVQPGAGFVELYQAILAAWTAQRTDDAADVFGRLVPYLLGWAHTQESMVAVEKRIAHRRGLVASPACRSPHRGSGALDEVAIDRFLDEFNQIITEVS
ncbi:dihydrodipicolinate synthase family protein [Microbacterium marmarense]|uniref:Dihydrodipicolinate synthase family protein n=1 Tax=Microbacterium marmarense TaxID=3122051 RepID=A0ABU8LQX1_9MICO